MKRYRLRVAYDGTAYHGWQEQSNGITIEEVLNDTLSKVLKEEIVVIGASRTDAGVHAYGNVAVFDSNTSIPADKICYAVNPFLPADIRIVQSEQVADDFHPRFVTSKKTYEYHIRNSRIPFPTNRLYSHQVIMPLDVEAMREAGKYIVGTHDFKCFCAAKAQVKTTVRNVLDVRVKENGDEIIVEVQGEGFLYNMVRIITGTLIKVGLGAYPPEHVKEIIESKDRRNAGETVPAKGLFLQKIEYDD